MAEFLDVLKHNSFVGALASGILLIVIGWLINLFRNKIRAKNLYSIFKKEVNDRDDHYLSIHLLSSLTGYTESEVEKICSHHKNLIRNEGELQAWKLYNK